MEALGFISMLCFVMFIVPILYKRSLYRNIATGAMDHIEKGFYKEASDLYTIPAYHMFIAAIPTLIFVACLAGVAPSPAIYGFGGAVMLLAVLGNGVYFDSMAFYNDLIAYVNLCDRFKTTLNKHHGSILVSLQSRWQRGDGPNQIVLEVFKIENERWLGFDLAHLASIGTYRVQEDNGSISDELIQNTLKSVMMDLNRGFGYAIIDPVKHCFQDKVEVVEFVGNPNANPDVKVLFTTGESNAR